MWQIKWKLGLLIVTAFLCLFYLVDSGSAANFPRRVAAFNLRRDPFERAQENSNTYHDWMIDRAYVLGPMQVVASRFLMTLKDYPPSQAPGDWSLQSLERQIKGMTEAGR